jgi:choline dehydrogenase-like flavoprotein
MLIDAHQVVDGARIQADLAIIGGGPAGITLAKQFIGGPLKVCLIESGGLEYEDEPQSLYEGENLGIDYPIDGSRLRYLGGATNHWGGYCRTLDAIDFEKRDWVPNSGWPITRDDVSPYYEQAAELAECGPVKFDKPSYWFDRNGEEDLAYPAQRFHTRFFQFSPPTRFGERYRGDLASAQNVRVLLNANVTEIAVESNAAHVTKLSCATLAGRAFTVGARAYVLAAGGLENPRILLLSNKVQTEGLGNAQDNVGRYFMEHPHLSGFCDLVISDPAAVATLFFNRQKVRGQTVKAAFIPDPEFLRRDGLMNASFTMGLARTYRADEDESALDDAHTARRLVLKASQRLTQAADDPEVVGSWLGVGCACEQAPNPDSRVQLSEKVDALGQARITLDWRLSAQDRHSVRTHIRSLGLEFGAMGLGRLKLLMDDADEWPDFVGGGNHHMGTTRMSSNPTDGVVDADCKVHGIDNLYVAGSSVFVTGGSANPTLTLIALALRLGDHLKESVYG